MGIMWLVLLASLAPGQALAKKIDPEGDAIRHAMLTPALGLFSLYFMSGFCFMLGLSLTALSWIIIALNIYCILQIRARIDLEIPETIRSFRDAKYWGFTIIALLVSITPFLTYTRPMGVDWIGFSAITNSILQTGGMILPSPSIGEWIYPPAFPMLAAWQSSISGAFTPESVFSLGHLSFAALLLAISAIGDKMGLSHWLIMSMLLAPALFAKTLDSGYPTVASQLGIIIGLLMINQKINWTLVLFTAITIAMIHPTGLVYFSTLILSLIVLEKNRFSFSERRQITLVVGAIFLVVIAIIPAFNGKPVFSEYGWQGGTPLVMFSGFLTPLAIWAGWSLRHTYEAKLFILWITINWILSGIHMFDGIEGIPILSMLSYTLYSMSMHAFHIPMACLVALKLADCELFSEIKITRTLIVSTLFISAIAQQCLLELSEHDELHAQTPGDFSIQSLLDDLPANSIVYTENIHWGHTWNAPNGIGVSSVPTLGILQQTHSIQNVATQAIIADDYQKLKDLGITHAITSPIGTMQWEIASSNNWQNVAEIEGSILWKLTENEPYVSTFLPIVGEDMRPDPWREHRFRDPFNLGEQRLFISSGTITIPVNSTNANEICIALELVGEVSIEIENQAYSGTGWKKICLPEITEDISVSMTSESEFWINPTGASGRGDQLLDRTGIRMHWLEIITFEPN